MSHRNPTYKLLKSIIGTQTYRSDTSTLLAYNDSENTFLFRALNSTYFIQNDNDETINLLDIAQAKEIWEAMPIKRISNVIAAFPIF